MQAQIISKETFGQFHRYQLTTFKTRFGNIEYLVSDAELVDPLTNMPQIIRQGDDRDKVIDGLV